MPDGTPALAAAKKVTSRTHVRRGVPMKVVTPYHPFAATMALGSCPVSARWCG